MIGDEADCLIMESLREFTKLLLERMQDPDPDDYVLVK